MSDALTIGKSSPADNFRPPSAKGLVVVLVGATASGKTELALQLASRLGCEIVGADSRQVYRRLDIGTAKPTLQQRQLVPHHLIDHVEPDQDYQAWRFQTEFRDALRFIAARGRMPLVVGGTGLYIRAGIEGLSPSAPTDPQLRSKLHAQLQAGGPEALHRQLAALDAVSAARIHPRDPVRLIRALEICLTTGQPASEHYRTNQPQALEAPVCYLGIDWPRQQLHARIQQRTQQLLAAGWADEVAALLDAGVPADARSMQSLGYRELIASLRGELPPGEVQEHIVLQTRRYARRQLTWFRALPVHWLDAADSTRSLLDQALERLGTELP